jgi:hypothetical protein
MTFNNRGTSGQNNLADVPLCPISVPILVKAHTPLVGSTVLPQQVEHNMTYDS